MGKVDTGFYEILSGILECIECIKINYALRNVEGVNNDIVAQIGIANSKLIL